MLYKLDWNWVTVAHVDDLKLLLFLYQRKYKTKTEFLKNAQNDNTEIVAGSVWQCLFLYGSSICKLQDIKDYTTFTWTKTYWGWKLKMNQSTQYMKGDFRNYDK
jgi:hypothetical protein